MFNVQCSTYSVVRAGIIAAARYVGYLETAARRDCSRAETVYDAPAFAIPRAEDRRLRIIERRQAP